MREREFLTGMMKKVFKIDVVAEGASWRRSLEKAKIKDLKNIFEPWLCHSATEYCWLDLRSIIGLCLKC